MANINIVPTRMELNNMKGKLTGAVRGHDLLKKKSEALTMRFRSLLREIRETKLKVGELTAEALFAYTEVKFVASDISPTVIQSVGNMPQLLFMTIDNVAGVRVPDFTLSSQTDSSTALVGMARGGQQIQKAREAFGELLQALIKLARLQTSFQIIDDVLRVTNRRVNAMEFVLIPMYKNVISIVEFGLEETEKEEFYRLKKVKEKRKAMQEIEEQQRLARFAVKTDDKKETVESALDDSTDDSDLLF